MEKIFRNCIYQAKNLYRDKSFLFWTLLYPVIMAILFHTAFNGLIDLNIYKVNIGIEAENYIKPILENITILEIHEINYDERIKALNDEKIEGFIDKDLNIDVKNSGINQTIIKDIMDQIKQTINSNLSRNQLDFNVKYTMDKNQTSSPILIIFYSLIGMVSAYGIFPSITTVILAQGNLTKLGKRISTTPLKKKEFLLAGITISLLLNITSNIILLGFIKYILKIDLFMEFKYSMVLILAGNLFGVALGMFIGVSNKKTEGTKILMGIGTTLVLSALSGMMSTNIKIIIDKNIPILGRLNPVAIITNNLYRINLLGNTKSFNEGIIILLVYCLILITLSYRFLRRMTYDSI